MIVKGLSTIIPGMTEQPVPSSRRREIGSASARSLLLTVLGEFVHPRHSSVWTATLLDALPRTLTGKVQRAVLRKQEEQAAAV